MSRFQTVRVRNAIGVLVDPATLESQISRMMTRIATDSGDSSVTYTGMAAIGTASSAALWKITKYDESADEITQFADSGNFSQVWADRESLTYA